MLNMKTPIVKKLSSMLPDEDQVVITVRGEKQQTIPQTESEKIVTWIDGTLQTSLNNASRALEAAKATKALSPHLLALRTLHTDLVKTATQLDRELSTYSHSDDREA